METQDNDHQPEVRGIAGSEAVEATALCKAFGGQVVLRNIHVRFASGQLIAVVGGNGAGKTTLLRCLAGMLRPTSGQLSWFGFSAKQQEGRRLIGVVAHESCLYGDLSAEENLLLAARLYGVQRPKERVAQLLRESGLRLPLPHSTSQLSRGMRQRLAILRALVHTPPILFLDEPFSGTGCEAGADWLTELLRDLSSRGHAICFASHQLELVSELANRVILVRDGSVIDGRHARCTAGRNGHKMECLMDRCGRICRDVLAGAERPGARISQPCRPGHRCCC